MRRIQSELDTSSPEYIRYRRHNKKLAEELEGKQRQARFDRAQRDLDRIRKQNKKTVRERLELLLDHDAPFMELSTLAANMAYDGDVPGAAVVTGIGVVNGLEVVVIAGDSTIKGGAWYPITVKKICRALDIAIENRLPVIHLVDSAGAYLLEQSLMFADRYNTGGTVFRNQCILNGMGVPQIALCLGHCTAGGAYLPTLSNYSIIVRGQGAVFLGGPPLVKAATGEEVSVDELGGADTHASISGTTDYAVSSEEEGIALVREIVETFQRPEKQLVDRREPEEPFYDPDELFGILPDDIKIQFNMLEVIARIVDGSKFLEFKPDYGTTVICGFAYIWGFKVGILGNNGVIFNDTAHKITQFLQLCDQSSTPVIFLQNITGFMVGKEYEHRGITKDGAKLLQVQTNLRVPKFTVMVNGSFGAGNYAMCGRGWDPRFVFSFPNHQISMLGDEQAAKTLTEIKSNSLKKSGVTITDKDIDEIYQGVSKDYKMKSSAYYSTSEVWDDGLINPLGVRNALGLAISVSLNKKFGQSNYGTLRI